MEERHDGPDHDLLIQIDTKLERVILDVKELKDNLAARVSELEHEKVSTIEVMRLKSEADIVHGDHEKRLRRLERWGSMAIGAIALVELFIRFRK